MTTLPRISSARDPQSGQFSPPAHAWTVLTVNLPNGRVGYRIGASGRIYADRAVAVRHAMAHRPSDQPVGTLRTRVLFDAARPTTQKALRARLAAFGEGIEPEAAQASGEPSDAILGDLAAEPVESTESAESNESASLDTWAASLTAQREYLRAYAAALAACPAARANADAGTYDVRTGGYWTGD